jgi:cell division protein FtsI (penicillin-binding protein 3)
LDDTTGKRTQRLRIFGIFLAAVALLLVVRYAGVMLSGTGTAPVSRTPEIERGPILDRRGRILGIQTRLDTVTAWKPEIENLSRTVRILADILELSPRELEMRFQTANGFLIVQRTITPSQSSAIQREITAGTLAGIRLEDDVGRSYPEREAAAAVVGYVGVDGAGLSGIEYMFSGDLLPPASTQTESPLIMGHQVFLTIDLAIQSYADDLGRELRETYDADSVMIAVAHAPTGDILAMSAQPSFDPNTFREYTSEERRNRLISSIYEPGSVFKVFTLASFLDLGAIDLDDTFNTTGGYRADDDRFVISDLADYGTVTPREIIKFSSNVGAAYASENIDPGSFYAMLRRFGFGEETGIDLNGEERGLLAPPDDWSARTRQTLAIGQEIGTTAIQMVAAAMVLANEGILLRPQIVDRIIAASGETVRRFGREPIREVISPRTAATMLDLMNSATEPGGTARRIQVEGVEIAAKTGTAEVFDAESGQYSDEHFIASTLALFPADRPELVVYLVIDHPRGDEFYGGRIAAPAVDALIEFLVPYWDIPRDTDTVTEHSGRISVQEPVLPELSDTVPDYRGLPIRTLIPLLGRDNIRVRIEGSGYVVRQDPAPGTPVRPGMSLVLELE